jgi:bifunctional UDP-N-acetylglucosamine pyrophosphorylase/glucosamine-1-phosphate N-acetyltransferase
LRLPGKPVVVVGFQKEKVMEALGPQYIYAEQTQQLGTGHAALSAKAYVEAQNVLVLYGDMPFISRDSLEKMIEAHDKSGTVLTMATVRPPSFSGLYAALNGYGRIVRDDAEEILQIVEYKDCSEMERKILEVNPGIYVFNADWLWRTLPEVSNQNAQGEYYLTDVVGLAAGHKEKIASIEISPSEVIGINTPEELKVAERINI